MATPIYTSSSVQSLLEYTYANTLGTATNQEGLDYWTNALQSGDVSMDNFQSSFETYSREQGNTLLSDVALVNNVFEKGLGRTADAEELNFWTNELTTGNVTASDLVETMAIDYQEQGQAINVTAVKEAVRDEYNSQLAGYDVTLADPFSFEATDLTTDSGYQFRLQEGVDALDASAASRGMVQSGAQQKAITEYGQNLASEEYTNAYNKALTTYNTQQNAMLNVANLATGAAAETSDATSELGTSVTNALTNQGTATAQGITGSAAATNTALENALLALNL